MIRRPPRSTQSRSSAASDVYKRQVLEDHRLGCVTVEPDREQTRGSVQTPVPVAARALHPPVARLPVVVAGVVVGDHLRVTGPDQSTISQIAEPALTLEPTAALSAATRPARCASSGCSIFIASSTTTRSPSATAAPSTTATLTMVPCIGDASVVPATAPGPRVGARRMTRRPVLCARARPAAIPNLAGRTTSSLLPPTSTTTRSVAVADSSSDSVVDGAAAELSPASRSANSVSIHRVCTWNGVDGSAGAKAGSISRAWWNGCLLYTSPSPRD